MLVLRPHPSSSISTLNSIRVSIWRDGGRWHFRYLVAGAADLIMPGAIEPGRADDLWRHTCFEAFVGLEGGAYLEFNYSPSGQWAAYRFDGPRQGMRDEPATVEVWRDFGEDWIAIEAGVECAALRAGAPLGLSAVVEEAQGAKSYWALAHHPGPPDFHDRSCFTALLANIAAA